MDRSEILQMMAALQLSGMRAAYDEIVTTGIKRKHSIDHIIAALLKAEIAEKHARSIRYQMGIAKLPLAKELADFERQLGYPHLVADRARMLLGDLDPLPDGDSQVAARQGARRLRLCRYADQRAAG